MYGTEKIGVREQIIRPYTRKKKLGYLIYICDDDDELVSE